MNWFRWWWFDRRMRRKVNPRSPIERPPEQPVESCDFFWGGHGCDLELGHEGVHHCGGQGIDACSEYCEVSGRCRYMLADVFEDGTVANHEWGEWHDHARGFRIEDLPTAGFEELRPT